MHLHAQRGEDIEKRRVDKQKSINSEKPKALITQERKRLTLSSPLPFFFQTCEMLDILSNTTATSEKDLKILKQERMHLSLLLRWNKCYSLMKVETSHKGRNTFSPSV